ncbi:hypothetical protein FKM82_016224, partial [Ascaphus truei]
GKGLGKRENGISEAIKVKVKCDKTGIGHNSAEQFTFHWWDHVFNKTASNISVEADQDGVQVKRLTEEGGAVTNKKPRKGLANPNMLYGRFIKSATLLSGGEKPVVEASSSESSDSSDDEDEKLDLSSATKLTDKDLIKVCGGRTAHKGARHGLTMSAKLARLEEQERVFLAKYVKKEQKSESCKQKEGEDEPSVADLGAGKKQKKKTLESDHLESIEIKDISQETLRSRRKKKKSKTTDNDEMENEGNVEEQDPNGDQEEVTVKKKSKNKRKHRGSSPGEQVESTVRSTDVCVKSKKKKERKHPAELTV